MTWSIDVTGTKAAVTKMVTDKIDEFVKSYGAKEEETKDALAAKDRILAIVAAFDLDPSETPSYNAVHVQASGAQRISPKGIIAANIVISIERKNIAPG